MIQADSPNAVRLRLYRKTAIGRAAKRESDWRRHGILGMTYERYEKMYDRARGCCQICDVPVPVLDVDHDPRSGAVRGLLCKPCNKAMGVLDTDRLLLNALGYLGAFVLRRAVARLLALPRKW